MIKRNVIYALVLASAVLSGCASTPEPTVVSEAIYVRQDIPAELLVCADEPDAPQGGYSQKPVAKFLTLLGVAGRDCREKLAAVRQIIAE